MANAFLGYNNIVDDGTLTSNSQQSTLAITNLQTRHLTEIWRAAGNTSVNIDLDAGSSKLVAAIWMGGTNLTGATNGMVIKASDVKIGDSELLNSTITPNVSTTRDTLIRVLAAAITARYWRITLTDTGVTFIEAGRLFMGPILRPANNVFWSLPFRTITRTERKEMLGGQTNVYGRPSIRECDFRWGSLTEAELYGTFTPSIDRIAAEGKEVLFCLDETDTYVHEKMLWGDLIGLGAAIELTKNLRAHDYTIRSIL